eukprot:CAMPEP_0201928714 /NCGR_PEP_ID=MMETSP0903-20130614/21529_1 /ASSEMBLY_ACC=CAM_ASM_000552 /TAXON_ID=420261 /ORGANISM="Thalassiosira antarctica, Strain CCMP982" /LENGTH=75 /DNA_ID=CAMNT_0048467269 /DNA_START=1 /DNA_END=225 /DNA_ORIENTATION=+
MEELSIADHRLKTALDNRDRDLEAQMAKFDNKQNSLKERLDEINKKKLDTTEANLDVMGDDLVEINAGGKIIAAK